MGLPTFRELPLRRHTRAAGSDNPARRRWRRLRHGMAMAWSVVESAESVACTGKTRRKRMRQRQRQPAPANKLAPRRRKRPGFSLSQSCLTEEGSPRHSAHVASLHLHRAIHRGRIHVFTKNETSQVKSLCTRYLHVYLYPPTSARRWSKID